MHKDSNAQATGACYSSGIHVRENSGVLVHLGVSHVDRARDTKAKLKQR